MLLDALSIQAGYNFINAAFGPAMTGTTADEQYVPLENWRHEITTRPTIVALPVPRPYGDNGSIVNFRIDESLPEAIAAYIDWLVNQSAWTRASEGAGRYGLGSQPRETSRRGQ